MPMNRNVKANRESEDWTVTFLQSVLGGRIPITFGTVTIVLPYFKKTAGRCFIPAVKF
jgi:hypothetical protein